MAQSVERPTLDFDSGDDVGVLGLSPVLGSTFSLEFAWDSLSLSAPPPARMSMCALSNK